jgi:hypothetical protein
MRTSSNSAPRLNHPTGRIALAGALVLASVVYLSYWAGIPQRGISAFVIGAAALVGYTLGIAWLAWRVLLRPLPSQPPVPDAFALSREERRLLATLLAVGTLSLTVGGFWDEVWHRKFGLPFGSDLLWRPHWLIYFGLLLPPLLAASAWLLLRRRGPGFSLTHLRADRSLGWLLFLGAFLIVSLPADPAWHMLYGRDISAWSLPHLVLMLSSFALALLGSSFLLSTTATDDRWKSVLSLRPVVAFSLLFFVCATSFVAQVLLGDFAIGNPGLLLRPGWLLPSLVTGLAVLVGTLANHATRSFGAATAVGVLALGLRAALAWAFDFPQIGASAWLPLLPPLLAIDLLCAYRTLRRQAPPSVITTATLSLPAVVASIGMIPLFIGPFAMRPSGLGVSLVASWLAAVGAGWIGRMLGEGLTQPGLDPAPVRKSSRWMTWVAPALFSAAVLLFLFLVATAAPPTQIY